MIESFVSAIRLDVQGVWDPADEQACKRLLLQIDVRRGSDDPRPIIRRVWWREDEDEESPYLDVVIDGELVQLNPGDFLVAARMPRGNIQWSAMTREDLDAFRPR